MSAKIKEKIT